MFKVWEKIDGKVMFGVGVMLTIGVLVGVAKFVLWLQPLVNDSRILRFFFGWLF